MTTCVSGAALPFIRGHALIGVHRSRESWQTVFLKLRTAADDVPRTSLDELKAERHLSQEFPLSDSHYKSETLWHLRKNPFDKLLKNIMTIGIYDGHAFLIKDIGKLARICACVDCRARFTQACSFQRHAKTCAQGRKIIDCPNEQVKVPKTAYKSPNIDSLA